MEMLKTGRGWNVRVYKNILKNLMTIVSNARKQMQMSEIGMSWKRRKQRQWQLLEIIETSFQKCFSFRNK